MINALHCVLQVCIQNTPYSANSSKEIQSVNPQLTLRQDSGVCLHTLDTQQTLLWNLRHQWPKG